jgi:hypothetical protein
MKITNPPKQVTEEIKKLVKCNFDTGKLYWTISRPNAPLDKELGSLARGYLNVKILGKDYKVHRVIWMLHTGDWPKGEIDHINGIKTDNRIVNLRDVDRALNMQNQNRNHKGNNSGFLGVAKCSTTKKWRARITVFGKKIALGSYDTAEEASKVYQEYKKKLHNQNSVI